LNSFSRKYLVKGNEYLISDPSMFPVEYTQVINGVAEELLYYDKIAFQVYGENIPLAVLINTFGVKGIEELLEQQAIEFVLWTPMVTYLVEDIPGVLPLQSGNMSSKAHCDPEESIIRGLKWMLNPLPRRYRRTLTKKLEKVYKLPSPEAAQHAVEFGYQGFEANIFAQFGLPKTKELTELKVDERAELCSLANECLELAISASFKYDVSMSKRFVGLNRTEFQRLRNAELIRNVTDILFEIEQVPNFKELIKQGIIDIKEVPKIRGHKSSVKFRSWITQLGTSTKAKGIAKEYIDSIANTKGFFETQQGKFFKTVVVTAFSGVVGGVIGGKIGSFIGVTASKLAEPFIDLGLNLLDAYVFEGLTKGWSPKHYIDKEIRSLVERKK
ncbi:hypothetical protein, partial [Neomoorella thermoacetica]|uniref:hypothetical protein n=1 Tax=Neomoorella thermoacetica TaxID=1525 RepID=UPI000470EA60